MCSVPATCCPAVRSEEEKRRDCNPVYRRLHGLAGHRNLARDEAGNLVPTYMGLIKQIDDQLGC